MRSQQEAKELLARLYGFEFPDSLFLLHEFLSSLGDEEGPNRWSGLGMEPIGPLQVLSLPEDDLQLLKPDPPLVLHWRFSRDVPEFFSCLLGDQDWLHWGLLLDDPATGFRGAACYYHNDTSPIRVYPSLFSAILHRVEERTARDEPAAAEDRANHRAERDRLHRFSEKFKRFLQDRQIPLDDGRDKGLASDTGLDLQVAGGGDQWVASMVGDWSVFPPTGHPQAVHFGRMKEAREIKRLVREAVAAIEKGRALPALSLGRSLWYYGGLRSLLNSSPDYSAVAYDLLRRAYTQLDRPALARILEVHFEHRDMASVDLLEAIRKRDLA
jgi:hypothetical protein